MVFSFSLLFFFIGGATFRRYVYSYYVPDDSSFFFLSTNSKVFWQASKIVIVCFPIKKATIDERFLIFLKLFSGYPLPNFGRKSA